MSDTELELHIATLGRLIEKAFADGDRKTAVAWSEARTAAINARSPAQVARMESCYFDQQGAADRATLKGSRIQNEV